MIEKILKNNNLKVTNQRIKILNIINELGCNSTLKNIIDNSNDVDTSTIYRTIKTLEDRNIIEEISGINDDVIYVISDSNKHYIKCIKCNSIKEIDICPIELDDYIDGYKIISHSLVIDGICKRCQGEEKPSLLCSL